MSETGLSDVSVYLPSSALTEPWGVSVTGAGRTRVPPGVAYPPGRHPDDHTLSWERGRMLHVYQLVYVSEGQGRFESTGTGPRKVTAGTAFVLFPGVWHRYQPLREVGWLEDWVEFNGPSIERLRDAGLISPRNALLRVGHRPDLLNGFTQIHDLARRMPQGHGPILATLALQILARALSGSADDGGAEVGADEAVRQAQLLITGAADQALRMEDVAGEVGMSYSHFRRAFRARTGISPKQYHLQLRLRKAQELLGQTSLSIKQVADALGFDSPFHLSADFKARTGVSPTEWRSRIATRSEEALVPAASASGSRGKARGTRTAS
jgi:AraC-like DNA-binding protein